MGDCPPRLIRSPEPNARERAEKTRILIEGNENRRPNAVRSARLWRDGELILDWRLLDRTVLGPTDWVDAPLWQGFIPWAGRELDHETAEAAVALRRACDISRGRQGDLDEFDAAESLAEMMAGICHAFQPQNVELAIRHKGSGRDFTDHPDLLLADFDARDR